MCITIFSLVSPSRVQLDSFASWFSWPTASSVRRSCCTLCPRLKGNRWLRLQRLLTNWITNTSTQRRNLICFKLNFNNVKFVVLFIYAILFKVMYLTIPKENLISNKTRPKKQVIDFFYANLFHTHLCPNKETWDSITEYKKQYL